MDKEKTERHNQRREQHEQRQRDRKAGYSFVWDDVGEGRCAEWTVEGLHGGVRAERQARARPSKASDAMIDLQCCFSGNKESQMFAEGCPTSQRVCQHAEQAREKVVSLGYCRIIQTIANEDHGQTQKEGPQATHGMWDLHQHPASEQQ